MTPGKWGRWVGVGLFSIVVLGGVLALDASGEYGDVVLNHRSEIEGMRPVVFPHWFHRIRFQCRVCHSELGFEMKVGATRPTMNEITSGAFCGACHDGEMAWSVDNCGLCHSAVPGTVQGIVGGHETLGPGVW